MPSSPLRQHGLSLIEMMIALVLGLMIIGVVLGVLITSNRAYTEDDRSSRMQENGRFAMEQLARDVSMAGFFGKLVGTGVVTTALAANCGVTFTNSQPVMVYNLADSTEISNYPCVTTGEWLADTTALLVQRTQGAGESTPVNGKVYLRSDGQSGIVVQFATGDPASNPPAVQYWEYVPSIYYIRNYARTAGDGIPTLQRKVLTATSGVAPTLTSEQGSIAEGVENFFVEFGIDTDGDGTPNRYTSVPTAAQLTGAINARIFVLVRSLDADPAYENKKTYTLGGSTVGPFNDRFYRRVFSTTITLRNTAYVGNL